MKQGFKIDRISMSGNIYIIGTNRKLYHNILTVKILRWGCFNFE